MRILEVYLTQSTDKETAKCWMAVFDRLELSRVHANKSHGCSTFPPNTLGTKMRGCLCLLDWSSPPPSSRSFEDRVCALYKMSNFPHLDELDMSGTRYFSFLSSIFYRIMIFWSFLKKGIRSRVGVDSNDQEEAGPRHHPCRLFEHWRC